MRLFLAFLFAPLLWTHAESVEAIQETEAQLEKRVEDIKSALKKKVFEYHKKNNSSSELSFLWESVPEKQQKKNFASRILSFEIQKDMNTLRALQERLDALQVEQEWLKWNQEQQALSDGTEKKVAVAPKFQCQNFPALNTTENTPMTLLQDFGTRLDKETGLSWPSTGWWIGGGDGLIRNCQSGVVVFWGVVPGRQWVAVIDHQNGWTSVYGNLNPTAGEAGPRIRVGQKIRAGTILGDAKAKFYFEVRKEGVPQSPRESFSSAQLPKMESQSL